MSNAGWERGSRWELRKKQSTRHDNSISSPSLLTRTFAMSELPSDVACLHDLPHTRCCVISRYSTLSVNSLSLMRKVTSSGSYLGI